MKLNIGCGNKKMSGFINIDYDKKVNPDKLVNIENGLPFEDNTFSHIYSSHTLEHILPCKFSFVLNEIYRVAKDKCLLELILPFYNPQHVSKVGHFRGFTWQSFNAQYYYNDLYYSKLKLKPLFKYPNKLKVAFYYMFPFLLKEVKLKFEIVKGDK